jgi:hypothetical protein
VIRILLLSAAIVTGSLVALFGGGVDQPKPRTSFVVSAGGGGLSDNLDGSFALTLNDVEHIRLLTDGPGASSGSLTLQHFETVWNQRDGQLPLDAEFDVGESAYPMRLVGLSVKGGSSSLSFRVLPTDESFAAHVLPRGDLKELQLGSGTLLITGYQGVVMGD